MRQAFDRGDASQESQYTVPYHYIPAVSQASFAQHLYWSWGYHYLGGLELVLSQLEGKSFESLLDVGSGDGRFLMEVCKTFPGIRLLGIDSSARAIGLARAMNPAIEFRCMDICASDPVEQFDVVTLIEVLEHIPIEQVDEFISGFSRYVKPGGILLMTVPHRNKPVQVKHYQHFSSESVTRIVGNHYDIQDIVFFDKRAIMLSRIMDALLGNRLFILNNRLLLKTLFSVYRRFLLHCSEVQCGRMLIEGRRK